MTTFAIGVVVEVCGGEEERLPTLILIRFLEELGSSPLFSLCTSYLSICTPPFCVVWICVCSTHLFDYCTHPTSLYVTLHAHYWFTSCTSIIDNLAPYVYVGLALGLIVFVDCTKFSQFTLSLYFCSIFRFILIAPHCVLRIQPPCIFFNFYFFYLFFSLHFIFV